MSPQKEFSSSSHRTVWHNFESSWHYNLGIQDLNYSDDGVCIQNYWSSGHCPSSGIRKIEHDVSEADLFPSSDESRKTPILLCPLERAQKEKLLRLGLSKGPNKVDIFLPSSEDGNIVSETSCFSFLTPDDGQSPEPQ
jgi:hypothetical protein